ncbi:MAG: alpha-L-fucosidase [Bacteroidota bacterium]
MNQSFLKPAHCSSITHHSSLITHVLSVVALVLLISCNPQEPAPVPSGGGGDANPQLRTNATALQNWQNMRFGMFAHWGPVSLSGEEIGWSRGATVPISVYDSLYLRFNPVQFNADEWISVAKEAGMKYFVIITKHHDGFSMWPTKFSEYNIMATPFKRDVLKELELACEKQDILFGTYHSILDWKHPHYTTRYRDPRPLEGSDMKIYKEFLFNQVKELVQDYHTNILWFDGQWEPSWTHEYGMELYKYVRDLKDDILINNRVDKGIRDMGGMPDTISKYAGDFGTPEQQIGGFTRDFPWESCITIGTQWAWKPNDKLKSAEELINMLIQTVGGDGNLLLNVNPMPDGRIEPRQVDLLKEVGDWLKVNGEGVYGTRGGPFLPNDNVASTHKGKVIYLHVMNRSLKEIRLPVHRGVKANSVRILGGKNIGYDNRQGEIVLKIPRSLPEAPAYVLKIRINTNAEEIVVTAL